MNAGPIDIPSSLALAQRCLEQSSGENKGQAQILSRFAQREVMSLARVAVQVVDTDSMAGMGAPYDVYENEDEDDSDDCKQSGDEHCDQDGDDMVAVLGDNLSTGFLIAGSKVGGWRSSAGDVELTALELVHAMQPRRRAGKNKALAGLWWHPKQDAVQAVDAAAGSLEGTFIGQVLKRLREAEAEVIKRGGGVGATVTAAAVLDVLYKQGGSVEGVLDYAKGVVGAARDHGVKIDFGNASIKTTKGIDGKPTAGSLWGAVALRKTIGSDGESKIDQAAVADGTTADQGDGEAAAENSVLYDEDGELTAFDTGSELRVSMEQLLLSQGNTERTVEVVQHEFAHDMFVLAPLHGAPNMRTASGISTTQIWVRANYFLSRTVLEHWRTADTRQVQEWLSKAVESEMRVYFLASVIEARQACAPRDIPFFTTIKHTAFNSIEHSLQAGQKMMETQVPSCTSGKMVPRVVRWVEDFFHNAAVRAYVGSRDFRRLRKAIWAFATCKHQACLPAMYKGAIEYGKKKQEEWKCAYKNPTNKQQRILKRASSKSGGLVSSGAGSGSEEKSAEDICEGRTPRKKFDYQKRANIDTRRKTLARTRIVPLFRAIDTAIARAAHYVLPSTVDLTPNRTKLETLQAKLETLQGRTHKAANLHGNQSSLPAAAKIRSDLRADIDDKADQQLTDKEKEDFQQAFDRHDVDESGTIDKSELATVMRSLNQNPSEELLKRMMDTMGGKDDGEIDFKEFIKGLGQFLSELKKNKTSADDVKERSWYSCDSKEAKDTFGHKSSRFEKLEIASALPDLVGTIVRYVGPNPYRGDRRSPLCGQERALNQGMEGDQAHGTFWTLKSVLEAPTEDSLEADRKEKRPLKYPRLLILGPGDHERTIAYDPSEIDLYFLPPWADKDVWRGAMKTLLRGARLGSGSSFWRVAFMKHMLQAGLSGTTLLGKQGGERKNRGKSATVGGGIVMTSNALAAHTANAAMQPPPPPVRGPWD